jgi:hypothetical protein
VREPLRPGASGAGIDRLSFSGGTILVLKRLVPSRDWTMQETHDTGRAAELWISGAMDRCPRVVDPAIVRIERAGEEWWIYMRDVSRYLRRPGQRVRRADAHRVIAACADLHEAFWMRDVPGLSDLRSLLTLEAPATAERRLAMPDDPTGEPRAYFQRILRGWGVFAETVPSDLTDVVFSVHADPSRLAGELEACGTTLVHSDPHFDNVAVSGDRVIFLDWSLAAGAPGAMDFAWFLDEGGRFVDAARDELIADFRILEGPRFSERALHLAFLAQFVLNCWGNSLRVADADPSDRDRHREHLDWWARAARATLDHWWAP